MPEGPELHLSSQFINSVCKGRIFSGTVRKNPIHKSADVGWNAAAYTISSVSRGKEIKVFLQSLKTEPDGRKSNCKTENGSVNSNSQRRLQLLFNFGMSGKFEFTPVDEIAKHAHLTFFTKEGGMALSFVDYRRFGKWQIEADWSSDRGPCVMFEYPQFRSNVLGNLSHSVFNKPLCEVLLNQKYFNGIGNYLRAEICYRAGVRPFEQARAVFADLPLEPEEVKVKAEGQVKVISKAPVKTERPDILQLCSTIPLEVVSLGTSLYLPEDDDSDMSRFSQWLQCYYKPGMKNVNDHNKRTMWFTGDPGPMVPREGAAKKRHSVYDKKLAKGGKKMKKEEADDDAAAEEKQRENGTEKGKKPSKSSKQDNKPKSPVKGKRVTRKTLKTLEEDESSERGQKTAAEAKKATKRKATADRVERGRGKKCIRGEEGLSSSDRESASVTSKRKNGRDLVKDRATRAAVRRACRVE